MLKIDKSIFDTNRVICKNIIRNGSIDRGFLSQNILGQIRNFVEYVAIKIFLNGKDSNPQDYTLNSQALQYIKRRGDLRFLYKFHDMLQKSVSHYTVDEDCSERLMLKYYEYLFRIKKYLKDIYNMNVLENIKDFPLNTDTELRDYYEKIAKRIEHPSKSKFQVTYNDRYYVQKVKPLFINQKVYYQVTFCAAIASTSKFERIIAFTQLEIAENYAVKFSIHGDKVRLLGKDMPVLIIDNYNISIRPCEWSNFARIFGMRIECSTNSSEYQEMMRFLSVTKMSLTELVSSDQDYYDSVKCNITRNARTTNICDMLDKCRNIIINDKPAANLLRYLLNRMNNNIIKKQLSNRCCYNLSGLYVHYGCKPFDEMPYCSSLVQHNPRICDLYDAIPTKNREHELFARYIKNKTEIEGHLFIPKGDIKGYQEVNGLIKKYNSSLYSKHARRELVEYKGYIYIKSYAEDSIEIIERLKELSLKGVAQYKASVDSWIERGSYVIDDDNKKQVLRDMFETSRVALIYGSAGTGKSTLIKHISNFWADKDKIFLANTHPAVDNMRRKVTDGNSRFLTIAKFLSKKNSEVDCDILFIDECSTVSNCDMKNILNKANFKLLVLSGDIYQIESISFGNWFSLAQKFIQKTSLFELKTPYRSKNQDLITLWKRVRELDDFVLETLVNNGYVSRLDESVFEYNNKHDEIILCANYDGIYGINNINSFLQNCNPSEGIVWGINTYKVGDPVLFNEFNVFSPLIHNNSKGCIVGIREEEHKIRFDIELEESINEIEALSYNFELIGESESGNSIISFSVDRSRGSDEDDDRNDSSLVPFQVAYAVSIHKAQGLEYNSVKIVVTNEAYEQITHNVFYTAVTRAKEHLKVYWSPETEKLVLDRFKPKELSKDAYLLSCISNLKLNDY